MSGRVRCHPWTVPRRRPVVPNYLPRPNRTPDGVVFLDHNGTLWKARELTCGADCREVPDARHRRRCLTLESESALWRVWQYPGNWRELSAEGLVALLSARGEGSPVEIEFVGGPRDGHTVRTALGMATVRIVVESGAYFLMVTHAGSEYVWVPR